MVPKAICRSLLYTFGWKSFIEEHLSDPALENHSRYNSFTISSEDGKAKLRAKKLPQDVQLVPRAGIRLLKEGHPFGPIGIAEFRIEKVKFDQILKGLRIFMANLSLEVKMSIETSWSRLRKTLECLPNRAAELEKMSLESLPKQYEVVPTVPDHLIAANDIPPLRGDLYPEEIEDGHLEDEVTINMDVCVFTTDQRWRPWLGRIVKILANRRFVLQWYARKSTRSLVFKAMTLPDGSPSLAELENETVMFWMCSEPQSRTADSFSLSPYWLETIMLEYSEMDKR